MRQQHLLLLVSLAISAIFYESCSAPMRPSLASVSTEIRSVDPIDQLVVWETQANLAEFREPESSVTLVSTAVQATDVTTEISINIPEALKQFIGADNKEVNREAIRWVFHPFNTYRKNLFYDQEPIPNLSFSGQLTASRSIIFRTPMDQAAYSIKLPTNYPHKASHQPEKLRMNEETLQTLPISNYVREVDTARGQAPELLPLLDVASVYRNDTKNGYTIRDLTPLQNGSFYYFPAVSIDTAGDELMKSAGIKVTDKSRRSFWIKNYVETTGRARALLLLRYGLMQETPNAQNWLIEIDKNGMIPTGRVVVRDLIDTYFLMPYGEKLGHLQIISEIEKLGQKPRRRKIDLRSKIIVWQSFLENDTEAINAHEQSFLRTMTKELHLKRAVTSLAELELALKDGLALQDYAHRAMNSQKTQP